MFLHELYELSKSQIWTGFSTETEMSIANNGHRLEFLERIFAFHGDSS